MAIFNCFEPMDLVMIIIIVLFLTLIGSMVTQFRQMDVYTVQWVLLARITNFVVDPFLFMDLMSLITIFMFMVGQKVIICRVIY